MKEYKLDSNTFMGGWFMPENVIDSVLDWSKRNEYKLAPGLISGGRVIKEYKDSFDIKIYYDDYEKEIVLYREYLQKCLDLYTQKYEDVSKTNSAFNVMNPMIYQYYKPGGGFKLWHNERAGISRGSRLLVFMTYLNDVENGGTEFKNFNLITPAKKGLTLIWPTDWPWTHKGQVTNNNEKQILTGWFGYND